MDIFEEIKEAVLSATPGEDTRNYYRNQGMAIERERIIKLLEERKQKVGHSLDKIGAEAREYWQIKCRVLELETAIALIKGEK